MLSVDHDRPNVGWLQVTDDQPPHSAVVDLTFNGANVTGLVRDFVIQGATQPGISMPSRGQFNATLNQTTLSGDWSTDVNTNGTFALARIEDVKEHAADHIFRRWSEFR